MTTAASASASARDTTNQRAKKDSRNSKAKAKAKAKTARTKASCTTIKTTKTNNNGETKRVVVTITAQAPATTRCPVQCWALNRRGRRCHTLVKPREGEPIPIPYCRRHLDAGDYALNVVSHPLAGKCLVARYDLPQGYRMAYWGHRGRCPTSDQEDRSISYYPPHPATGSNQIPGTAQLKRHNYNGVLNPKDTGDILQYAACPGPTERQNIRSTFRYWGKRNGHIGGLEFKAIELIPQHTMLCHWYGAGWWSARGIQRTDIGTCRHPAPKRLAYLHSNASSAAK